jgi:hypothetical protein
MNNVQPGQLAETAPELQVVTENSPLARTAGRIGGRPTNRDVTSITRRPHRRLLLSDDIMFSNLFFWRGSSPHDPSLSVDASTQTSSPNTHNGAHLGTSPAHPELSLTLLPTLPLQSRTVRVTMGRCVYTKGRFHCTCPEGSLVGACDETNICDDCEHGLWLHGMTSQTSLHDWSDPKATSRRCYRPFDCDNHCRSATSNCCFPPSTGVVRIREPNHPSSAARQGFVQAGHGTVYCTRQGNPHDG